MQLVKAAGQLLEVANLPQNAQVRINGTVAVQNDQKLYALPVGQAAEVVTSHGNDELFRTQVPATAEGQRVRIAVPARPVSAAYEPGSRDDIRNRAAKAKACMSLFGIGAAVGASVALVKLWRS